MDVHRYGSDPSQLGELYRPADTATAQPGVVVIVHGGFWRAQYGLELGRPLAVDLQRRGYTVWNLEYRRVGNGGGWTATFDDVHAGIEYLTELDVDTDVVTAIGHSAGGHLAAWAGSRNALPPSSPWASPQVPLTGVVSQAGVLSLAEAAAQRLGGSAVADLLGVPDASRLSQTDPLALVPAAARVRCVHGRDDELVPLAQSAQYVETARRRGGDAALVEFEGGHFELIDPRTDAWQLCVQALADLHTASG